MIMSTYLIKVVLCSLVLLAYYFIALRNKKYHQFNRYYLLFCLIASWLIPILPFNFFVEQQHISTPIYNVLTYTNVPNLTLSNAYMFTSNTGNSFSITTIATAVFFIISIYFLLLLIIAFIKVLRIRKKYTPHKLKDCTIYLTNEKYTPYSFFKLIFWNKKIDLNSKIGNQILQHELVHIKEKHTWDKIFIQLNLIVGWFNPFNWIIKKELEIIHEFIADEKSIPNADVSEFASMILSIIQINKNVTLTNPFFFSPIKRRLEMLNKKHTIKYSYFQRVLALPVFVLLVIMLSLKAKQSFAKTNEPICNSTLGSKILQPVAQNNYKENSIVANIENDIAKVTNDRQDQNKKSDTTAVTMDELQKKYKALEQTYKKETALAKERKRLMELIEEQPLNEEQKLHFFKTIVELEATNDTSKNLIQQELEPILGKEEFKLFWKERIQIKKEIEAFLKY